ncbi:MAG: hypothetical protein MZV64_12975 [Ignavibacteriales bacterium]|nr:hypothetical protein [Ignavibacteriales bacterium]
MTGRLPRRQPSWPGREEALHARRGLRHRRQPRRQRLQGPRLGLSRIDASVRRSPSRIRRERAGVADPRLPGRMRRRAAPAAEEATQRHVQSAHAHGRQHPVLDASTSGPRSSTASTGSRRSCRLYDVALDGGLPPGRRGHPARLAVPGCVPGPDHLRRRTSTSPPITRRRPASNAPTIRVAGRVGRPPRACPTRSRLPESDERPVHQGGAQAASTPSPSASGTSSCTSRLRGMCAER